MRARNLMFLLPALAVGLFAAPPPQITFTASGKLAKIVGVDCLELDAEQFTVTAAISTKEKPAKSKPPSSATYKIPAGGVTITPPANKFTSTTVWEMEYESTAKMDTLKLTGTGPEGYTFTVVSILPSGSFANGWLTNPTGLSKSPVNLQITAPKTPGSTVTYTKEQGSCGGSPSVNKFNFETGSTLGSQ